MKTKNANVWSIILAGGNGSRMQPFIKQWLGRDIPKQYCSFMGERSMFQHTLERADQVTQCEQKITVISQAHEEIASPQLVAHPEGGYCCSRKTATRDLAYSCLCPISSFLLPMPPSSFSHLTILYFLFIGFFIFSPLGSMPWKTFRINSFFLESVP